MIKIGLSIIFPLVIFSPVFAGEITIKIVYNNVVSDKRFIPGWGMACVIEGLEKDILFDTGGNGSVLLSNMRKLNLDPAKIDVVFLSHIHSDHTGGIESFLDANPDVKIYVLSSFPTEFKNKLKQKSDGIIEVSDSVEICNNVYSTGIMGTSIKEQSLIIKTERGLIIVTGCAHPGVVNIARRALELFDDKIYIITGGFHLGSASDSRIRDIIYNLNELGVKKIGPSHCTGERAIEMFKVSWKNNFVDAGLGAVLHLR